MKNNAEKLRIARSAIALMVAALIIIGSVITVAAAVGTNEREQAQQGLVTEPGNIVSTNESNAVLDLTSETLKTFKVTITRADESKVIMMSKGTVADALAKAEISLNDNELAVPAPDAVIECETTVAVSEGININVTADKETKKVLVPNGTVLDALNYAGYKISADDILSVDKESSVKPNMSVKVVRVTYSDNKSIEKIAYSSRRENSDKLDLGKTKIAKKGVDGKKEVTVRTKFVDGKKAESKVIDTKVIKEPVDEVTLVGTRGVASGGGAGTFVDSNGSTVAYSRVLTGSGTAYTAGAGALCSTGVEAYQGGVAVNPSIIPYGSKLYIESTDGSVVYGYATAVDTGGALMDGSALVDCFYYTESECIQFGRRNVNVYVLA